MYKEFIISLVAEVAQITKKYFRNADVKYKEDGSVVTLADTTINALVIKRVKESFPTHDIYGEEESFLENKSEFVWVCDPVDGTFPFSIGVPTSVFSLALTKAGKAIVACVYDAHTDDFFYAEKGSGAFCNDKRISVSDRDALKTVGLTHWKKDTYDVGALYPALVKNSVCCYDFGSIVYMGMLVATGKFEAIIFPHTTAHDVATIKLLVEEAGGKCSDIFGKTQTYNDKVRGFIASNGKTHDELLKYLNEFMVIKN